MRTFLTLTLGIALTAAPLAAQQSVATSGSVTRDSANGTVDSATATAAKPSNLPPIQIGRLRANDKRGINVFEAPKEADVPFTGFRLGFGAAFTQQFQGLGQSNTAAPNVVNGANANQLVTLGHGFNNAVANAYLNAQLAKGIRVSMTAYLSARHHNETWVKDGYLQVDDSPIDFQPLNTLMQYVTIKAGHFEINYGDAHFRRTDNGNALFNPLVGNYILDAFAPQVGGEVYLHGAGALKGAFVMGGVTNGEEKGMVQKAAQRSPAFIGKVGIDHAFTTDVRARLTGSWYAQSKAANQVLFSGDRGGSRYYSVITNSTDETATAWTGMVQPFSGPSAGLHSAVLNPFLKYKGLEYFGNFERAKGKGASETATRTITQIVNELTLRGLGDDVYLSGRYNTVSGQLAGIANDVDVKRYQVGGGWFITPTVLVKGEWVDQKYVDFPVKDIRNGARFKGFVVEGTVAF
ncbi:hypothetical protein J421_5055 (plasmid) [Gemmatirosa kalamazoonensis]|uniref:Porin n=1 Tax=Gemmatirosa kalamazoonensis TaxID=861299 RepID=W0RQG3_9BACT|nr:hypothetical protein [Gemmatirosa kalamazoonensis]AHG92590.1 hypothetical protein J421_5055 [Gemmatirosa kalamazoonensis]